MQRLRRTGLVAVMALALSGMCGAGMASASTFVAGEYPASFEAPGEVAIHKMTFQESTTNCENPGLSSSVAGGASTELTVAPADTTCNLTWKGTGKVKMNGCEFTFHPGAAPSEGEFDIGPAGCGPISFENYKCNGTIGAQTGLNASYQTIGSGSSAKVEVTLKTSAMKYTATGGVNCELGTFNDGGYEGSWQVSAENSENEQIGLRLASAGIFVNGEAPLFEAEEYPLASQGAGSTQHVLDVGTPSGGILRSWCDVAEFESSVFPAPAVFAQLLPTYDKCVGGGGFGIATVDRNGCFFEVSLDSGGTPGTGKAHIQCPGGGVIEITTFTFGVPKCTIEIGGQEELDGITFTNIGEGGTAGIEASIELEGISYVVNEVNTNFFCKNHSGEDGTYTGTVQMVG